MMSLSTIVIIPCAGEKTINDANHIYQKPIKNIPKVTITKSYIRFDTKNLTTC